MLIANSVNDYLLIRKQAEEQEHQKSTNKYYLSDMGKCQRMRFLKRKGITMEFLPYVHWVFEMGNLTHSFVYKALESKGILLECEDTVATEHFSGRFDGIVKLNDGKKSVLDIKTVNSFKFQKIMAGVEEEDNIAQVLSYLMLLKDGGRKDLESSLLLYVNKEPNDKAPFAFFQKEFFLTKWREDKLREEMVLMENYWTKNKIPKCTCPAWMKPYNAFQPLCEMEESSIRKVLTELGKGKKVITSKESLCFEEGGERKLIYKVKPA
jgi:predicted hydrocarbon binding protein